MDIAKLIDELLAPLAGTARGADAVARLKEAINECISAADDASIDWPAMLAATMPKLIKLTMGFDS